MFDDRPEVGQVSLTSRLLLIDVLEREAGDRDPLGRTEELRVRGPLEDRVPEYNERERKRFEDNTPLFEPSDSASEVHFPTPSTN